LLQGYGLVSGVHGPFISANYCGIRAAGQAPLAQFKSPPATRISRCLLDASSIAAIGFLSISTVSLFCPLEIFLQMSGI
jgi:hypothetical protein